MPGSKTILAHGVLPSGHAGESLHVQVAAADVRARWQRPTTPPSWANGRRGSSSFRSCPARPRSSSASGRRWTLARPRCRHRLTTRELGKMIHAAGIDFDNLPDEEMDAPLGLSRRRRHLRQHRRRHGGRSARPTNWSPAASFRRAICTSPPLPAWKA